MTDGGLETNFDAVLRAADLEYSSFFAEHCRNIRVMDIEGEQVGGIS